MVRPLLRRDIEKAFSLLIEMKRGPIMPLNKKRSGFTLVELLIVISIIATLAGLLLPALAKAKSKGYRVSCLNNLKQMNIAWLSYSHDQGRLPETYFFHPTGAINTNTWVRGSVDDQPVFGRVDPGMHDSTNVNALQAGTLWKYLSSPNIYRCPADRSHKGGVPRVRSYSINSWMGGMHLPGQDNYRVFRKEADIVDPSPADAAVFIDEHENSINEGWFVIDMLGRGFFDAPSTRHGNSFTLTFADGHAEAWKLLSAGTLKWAHLPIPPSSDSERLRLSATSLKP